MLAAGAGAGPALPAQPAAPALPRTTPPTPVVTPQLEPEPSAPARKTTTELEMVLLAHQEQLALILHLAHEVQQSAAHNATITDALESAVRRIGHDLQVSLVSAVERVLEEVVEAIRISVGEVSGSTRRLESSTGPKLAEIREELRKVVKLLAHVPTPRGQVPPPDDQVDQVDKNQVKVNQRRPHRRTSSVLDDLDDDDD